MKWRYLYTGARSGPFNMAVDEALMLLSGQTSPTLRFFRWSRPTLSLGYFQSALQDIDLEACRAWKTPLVRRPTGGRAILHDRELTFSLVAPEGRLPFQGGILESYAQVSRGLVAGLRALGVDARASPPPSTPRRGPTSRPACFDATGGYEITVGGRKLVGSAQVRRGGVGLQHGSLLLEVEPEALFRLFRFPDEPARQRAAQSFSRRVTSLREVLGGPHPLSILLRGLRQGFSLALGLDLVPGHLTPEEAALARSLVKEKYSRPEWNLRR